jgi:hypothetical protein
VGLDVLAEFLELGKRNKTQPLRLYAGDFKILGISVNAILIILLESARLEPFVKQLGCSCVLIVVGRVGWLGFAPGNPGDVVFAFFVEPFQKARIDDIIRRCNAAPDVAYDRLVEPVCLKSFNFHFHTQDTAVTGL